MRKKNIRLFIFSSVIFFLFILLFNNSFKIVAADFVCLTNIENQTIVDEIRQIKGILLYKKNNQQYFIVIEHLFDLNYIEKFFNNEFILILFKSKNVENSIIVIFYDNKNKNILFSFKLYYLDINFLRKYLKIYITAVVKSLEIYKRENLKELYLSPLYGETIIENQKSYYFAYEIENNEDSNFKKVLLLNILLFDLQKKGFYNEIQKSFYKRKFNRENFYEDLLNIVNLLEPHYDLSIKNNNKIFYFYLEEMIDSKLAEFLKIKNINNNIKFIISYLVFH